MTFAVSRLAALCLATLLALPAPFAAAADPAIIYLTRHGEKAKEGKDPVLTEQGQARARHIAATLRSAGITQVFSSATNRTRQTAQPLAAQHGITVQEYDPGKPAAMVEQVKAAKGKVLVVGHSNTVPDLVRMFGGAPGSDIGDEEYDRLYQLIVAPDGSVTTVLLHSVAR